MTCELCGFEGPNVRISGVTGTRVYCDEAMECLARYDKNQEAKGEKGVFDD